jgi:hypothetical protein
VTANPDEAHDHEITLVRRALATLIARLERGEVTPTHAVEYAFALGGETERAEAMHRACREYSRTHYAREDAYRRIGRGTSPPDDH